MSSSLSYLPRQLAEKQSQKSQATSQVEAKGASSCKEYWQSEKWCCKQGPRQAKHPSEKFCGQSTAQEKICCRQEEERGEWLPAGRAKTKYADPRGVIWHTWHPLPPPPTVIPWSFPSGIWAFYLWRCWWYLFVLVLHRVLLCVIPFCAFCSELRVHSLLSVQNKRSLIIHRTAARSPLIHCSIQFGTTIPKKGLICLIMAIVHWKSAFASYCWVFCSFRALIFCCLCNCCVTLNNWMK